MHTYLAQYISKSFVPTYIYVYWGLHWNSRVHIYLFRGWFLHQTIVPFITKPSKKMLRSVSQNPISFSLRVSLWLSSRSFSKKKRPSASKWWILLELTPVLLAHLPRQMPWTITENPKGQIISEWLLDVFIWTNISVFCPCL